MHWKLILLLSLFGLPMSVASFVVPASAEPVCWLVIFVFCAIVIARRCAQKHFRQGLAIGLVNSVWITAGHLLFFDSYLAHHPHEAEISATMSSPRLAMLLFGPIVGLASGMVLGIFALVASRWVKPVSAPGA